MIIGNGQLASALVEIDCEEVVFLASGVSNSTSNDINEFKREEKLLRETIIENKNKKHIYFSSCALSAIDYPLNNYYEHKIKMENLIKEQSSNYYIFRIPQLFGKLQSHKTLINFLYESIVNNEEFILYSNAYRYVIEINDLTKLVALYLNYSDSGIIVDLSNPYKYKVEDIVKILEKLLHTKASYKLVDKYDGYTLDFSSMKNFMSKYNINLKFSMDYLENKLKEQIDY